MKQKQFSYILVNCKKKKNKKIEYFVMHFKQLIYILIELICSYSYYCFESLNCTIW